MNLKTLPAVAAVLALAGLTGASTADAVPGTVSGDGGNRIGVLKDNGDAYVKAGSLGATWVKGAGRSSRWPCPATVSVFSRVTASPG
ncbi:hypothetical protein [Streptomyces sp. Ncost-T10-10d]|uniref:hypothetical protein n=1 Tax=Streptomyces sp. Ncost-T10-10d TaxID=1839774 RepID=UPI00081E4CBA|nr:hypothetical protein [Streptomyces sp. Ncost-T10-10d]SCF91397.1 hypothetical protein GA0115254_124652 [Streptomyces sp. Ncost-T10-10d]